MSGRPYELEILSDEQVGRGGFLHLRRLRLRNLRPDGTRSAEWVCDFVERERGVDAVVVVLHRQVGGRLEVLLRDGLRPALHYGRARHRVPLPDRRDYFFFTELPAGIIEEGEVGEAAVRRRAVAEVWEEAGVRLDPAAIELLGAGSFPSPGMTAEKFWLCAAPVDGASAPPAGDGSPMEEGATVRWLALDEALAMFERGELEDGKSELALRRFAARRPIGSGDGDPIADQDRATLPFRGDTPRVRRALAGPG